MTAGKSAREAWEEGYSWGYTDGARVGVYDAAQNPYATDPLPLDPKPWRDIGPAEGAERFPWEVDYSKFEPRPGYSQKREDYA